MTNPAITTFLEASRGGFTDDEIKTGFDLVKDPGHWKNSIDKIIARDQMTIVKVAVEWYTATTPTFTDTKDADKVRVTAAGYFNGPAGP